VINLNTDKLKDITILGIFSRFKENTKIKILSATILLPLIIILITLLYGYETINSDYKVFTKNIETSYQYRSDLVTTVIMETYKKSEMRTNDIRDAVTADLYRNYRGDLTEMRKDFDNRSYRSPFYQVISNEMSNKFISDNNRNRIVAATKSGILVDNSRRYSSYSFKSWDEIRSDGDYLNVDDIIYESIYNQYYEIMIIPGDGSQGITGEENAKKFIQDCMMSGDKERLYSSKMICVSYIFDSEDIFGVPDITAGHRNDNDKIYIIQVLHIGDLLANNVQLQQRLALYQSNIEKDSEEIKSLLRTRMGLIIALILLELITFFGVWYLSEFYVYNKYSVRKIKRVCKNCIFNPDEIKRKDT